jgi:nitrate reductase NapE component
MVDCQCEKKNVHSQQKQKEAKPFLILPLEVYSFLNMASVGQGPLRGMLPFALLIQAGPDGMCRQSTLL